MRSWFLMVLRGWFVLVLLSMAPMVHAQATCAVNGATGPNAAQGCVVAPTYWIIPNNDLGSGQVFSSKSDAEQAISGYLTQDCDDCNRGLLFSPLTIPPGASCDGAAACYGGYTRDSGPPLQNLQTSVVIWGLAYVGTPPIETYYSNSDYYGSLIMQKGQCPGTMENILDTAPNGSLVYMCEPNPTQTSQSPPAVVPTMTSLDSTDNGVCRTCQGVNLGTGTEQSHADDYTSGSPDGIDVGRYYNSATAQWSFDYSQAITYSPDTANNAAYVTLSRPDGSALNFTATNTSSAPDTWTANNGANQTFIAPLTDTKDSNGAITGFDYHNLHDEDEHYSANGRLASITPRSGNALTFTYDDQQRLARIDDAFGRSVTLGYTTALNSGSNTWSDGQGGTFTQGYNYYSSTDDWHTAYNLSSISDGTQTVQYHYSLLPNTSPAIQVLDQVTYPDGTTRRYGYDATYGLLTSVTDENGVAFENYTYYGGQGHAVTRSAHVGTADQVTYSTGVGSASVTDAVNRTFSLQFGDIYQGLSQMTYQSGPCTVCAGWDTYGHNASYDAFGNQTAMTDFNGNQTTRVFDTTRGLPTSITEASGTAQARTTQVTYSPSFRLPTQVVTPIAVNGVSGTRTGVMTYDTQGDLLSQALTAAVGSVSSTRTWSFTYNSKAQTLTAKGPRTDVDTTTHYSYDPTNGNLLSVTDALGHVSTLSQYNPEGLVGQTVDPNGLTTTMTYDARNRLVSVQRGSTATHFETWGITYAPTGLITAVTRPSGSSIGYVYDTSHRLVEIDDVAENGVTQGRILYTLDDASEVTATSMLDILNHPVAASTANYDAYGRLHQAIGSANQTSTYAYDTQGNLTSATDARQHSTSAQYDALNRLTQTTDAIGGVANLTHDVADNLVSAQDPRGASTTYQRNGFDEVSAIVSPDSGTTTLAHDPAGNVTQTVDASGRTATFSYDALNRPTQVIYARAGTTGETQTFTYDSCTNGIGRLCTVTDASGSTLYTYDLFGRVTAKTQVVMTNAAAQTFSVGYTYDTSGRAVGLTYPSGQGLARGFLDERPIALTMGSTPLLMGTSYLPFSGDVQGWTWSSDSSSVSFQHDLDEQTTAVVDADTRDYAYDANGNVTGVSDPTNTGYQQAYTYDAMNRLTVSTTPAVAATYGYDLNANRTSAQQGSTAYTFTVDLNSNRYTAVNGTTIATDAAGNITSDGINAYTFDDKGRMASSTNAQGLVTSYAYNALGQRVSKTNSNGTTFFVYDEDAHLIGTYDASGHPLEEMVYLEDRPVADLRGSSTYRVLTDPLQTPRALIDASGTTVWSWDGKEAFGASAPGGSLTFNLRFPGQYADVETGLFNNGFRDYAPAWGRYVESDPIGLAGGWNTYGYVDGNPIDSVDTLGLSKKNLFDASSDPILNKAFNDLPNPVNELIIGAHGGVKDQIIYSGNPHGPLQHEDGGINAQQLSKNIKSDTKNFHPGMSVTLWGCSLGVTNEKGQNFAQDLANYLGAPVKAANGAVVVYHVPQIPYFDREKSFYTYGVYPYNDSDLQLSIPFVFFITPVSPAWTTFYPK